MRVIFYHWLCAVCTANIIRHQDTPARKSVLELRQKTADLDEISEFRMSNYALKSELAKAHKSELAKAIKGRKQETTIQRAKDDMFQLMEKKIAKLKELIHSEVKNLTAKIEFQGKSLTAKIDSETKTFCQVGTVTSDSVRGSDPDYDMTEAVAEVDVKFPRAFPAPPNVAIAMNFIREIAPGGLDVYGWGVKAEKISKTGFKAKLTGYDRYISSMGASWVACH